MLRGRTIAVTRPREQAGEASRTIEREGGRAYLFPTIEIKRTRDPSVVEKFIADLEGSQVDYVVFMSANAVRCSFEAAEALGQRHRLSEALDKTTIVAVGPKTANELAKHGVHTSLVPRSHSSAGVLGLLRSHVLAGRTIYLPRTRAARPTLSRGLRKLGAEVREFYVYESLIPNRRGEEERFLRSLTHGAIDAVIFSSPLTAKNLFRMLGRHTSSRQVTDLLNSRTTVVAIGPTTAKALKKLEVKVDVLPRRYLFEDALRALGRYWDDKTKAGANEPPPDMRTDAEDDGRRA